MRGCDCSAMVVLTACCLVSLAVGFLLGFLEGKRRYGKPAG